MNIFAKSNAENGEIVLVTFYDREKDGFGLRQPESGSFDPSNTVEFDTSTNTAEATLLNDKPADFNVVSGVLHRNGNPVTINPDGPELEFFRQAQNYVDGVVADMGTVTLNEVKAIVAWLVIVNANARDF